jgi:hypothetical protein
MGRFDARRACDLGVIDEHELREMTVVASSVLEGR